MIDITHEEELLKVIADGVTLKQLVRQYLLLSVAYHKTTDKASECTGVAKRTYYSNGVRPRGESRSQINLIQTRWKVK